MVSRVLVLVLLSVGLAGCADSEDSAPALNSADLDDVQLEEGKGAIAGLLVDDRFRPIVAAKVLLQQTAETFETNENGEFFFLDLEPGSYTLRANAEAHEAAPATVRVEEGLFAEASVMARRVANNDGVLITEELAAFVACNANLPPAAVNCGTAGFPPDMSGDTSRSEMWVDYQYLGDNITYWVIEMITDKPAEKTGAVKLIVRNGPYYVNDVITDGSYLWTMMQYNETSLNDVEDRNDPFTNDREYLIQVWAQGHFKEETHGFPANAIGAYDSRGVGVQLGLRANFLSSLFLYDPTVDAPIEDYCALC